MKKFLLSAMLVCGFMSVNAETIIARYYGSEIDLTQKDNPCKGRTDGGVVVVVETRVNSVKGDTDATIVERVYSLPNGEVLKSDKEIINSPKAVVLHKLFPRQFPEVKM